MRRPLEATVLAAVFAVAYTQSPLYFSNQNQYFVQGLADGGHGHLAADWLANTRDPTPVFSALVTVAYRTLGEWSFQAAYFLLLMAYFVAARILVAAFGAPDTRAFRLAFAAMFTAAHAAILRWLSVKLTGVDYPWNFQAGVAGQYMLGAGLQPSAFGVLLLASLAAFAHDRPTLAGALAASACVFHSTYLLPAGLLVGAMLLPRRRRGEALRIGGVALLIVLPVIAYTLRTFSPTNTDTFAESQRILAEVRIPHHAVLGRWFDWVAALQLAWIGLGVWLVPLCVLVPVVSLFVWGTVLTGLQWASGDPTFALMFPWRVSVVLMPVATAVICTKLAALQGGRQVSVASGVLLGFLAFGGLLVTTQRLGYHSNDAENELYAWVRANAKSGDVFLLPVRIPAVGTGRGAVSTSFTPPPRPKPGSNLIPVDLQRFRLHAAAPIYVDFKAVPYADKEVLEWLRRMKRCEAWYDGGWDRDELKAEGVTHVVSPLNRPLAKEFLEEVHRDRAYFVYRVK